MYKILHFSIKPPFPAIDGGCIAIADTLKCLMSIPNAQIFHFTLSTHKHPYDNSAYPDDWRNKIEIHHGTINTKIDPFNAAKYLIKNESYNVARFYDKKVEKQLQQLLQLHTFDIILMESIYLLPYIHLFKNKQLKVIVRTHNAEHQIWATLAEQQNKGLKKWYFKTLAKQLKKFEQTACRKVDGILTITEDDASFFRAEMPHVKIATLPTAFSVNSLTPNYELNDFYFLGAMDWSPNRDGVKWLIEKVMNNTSHDFRLYLAGKHLNKHHFNHKEVQNLGEIENSTTFIAEHGICLIPIRSGSGLKIKLLENMAMGKPIITTNEGAKGVPVTHNKEVLIADTPQAFIDAMALLHSNMDLRKQLGENARQFIQNHYSKEHITQQFIAFINNI